MKAYEAIKSVINNILAQIEKFTCDVKRYINEALEWIKEIPDYLLEQFVGVGMIDTLEADAKKLLEMVGFFITSMRAAMNDLFENQFNKPVMQAFEAFNIFGFAFRDILSKATPAVDDAPGGNLRPGSVVTGDLDETASGEKVLEISATQKIINYIRGANP